MLTDAQALEREELKLVVDPDRGRYIGFGGKMCTGKTLLAKILRDDYGYNIFSFADEVREAVQHIFPLLNMKDKATSKQYLQRLGTTARELEEDVWINKLLEKCFPLAPQPLLVVVDDVRYSSEFTALEENGFVLVKLVCDEPERLERIKFLYGDVKDEVLSHRSETEIDSIPDRKWDYILNTSKPLYMTIAELRNIKEGILEQ